MRFFFLFLDIKTFGTYICLKAFLLWNISKNIKSLETISAKRKIVRTHVGFNFRPVKLMLTSPAQHIFFQSLKIHKTDFSC